MHKVREEIIVVVHVGAVKIYLTAAEALIREKGRQDETQFITKCVGKTIVWVPVISLCKYLFPELHI
jgi:hypothetical protein